MGSAGFASACRLPIHLRTYTWLDGTQPCEVGLGLECISCRRHLTVPPNPSQLRYLPFAPFSKNERLGRACEWTKRNDDRDSELPTVRNARVHLLG